jgi:hypothetical protein
VLSVDVNQCADMRWERRILDTRKAPGTISVTTSKEGSREENMPLAGQGADDILLFSAY